ncbi:hypothetical protein SLS56_002887 [Neofusicoccum ribis]|uniref:Small secreted protein n=1 Tax=Neofusicoccum ribis TaxID=45134 RepID=A0ABR3T2G4_9PEZI
MYDLLFAVLLISAVGADSRPVKVHIPLHTLQNEPQTDRTRNPAEESTPGDIIQLAECAKNTRVNGDQYFALFVLDSGQHLTSHGGPYGRCYAWPCALDPNTQFEFDERVVSLFWDSPQTGTIPLDPSNCIKDPQTAECGCEVSGSGDFAAGRLDCPVGQNGQLGCGTPSLVACGFELDGVGVGTWNIAQGDRSGALLDGQRF